MRYLLDTNICIYLIKEKTEFMLHKLNKALVSGVGISSITLSELEYSVQKSSRVEQNALNLLRFLAIFEILPYSDEAAREYGLIRVALEKKGQPIGGMDMLIGAHAKSVGAILVTNNEREFRKIDGLQVENWTRPKH
jgi:tRNA(fMet)-specific endonuclease VapC